MARQVGVVLLTIGVLVLLGGGASIFWRPADEVVYDASGPAGTCTPRFGCIALYRLEVGNTGSAPQEDVGVRLHAAVVESAVTPPNVQDYGKFDRPFRVSRDDDGDSVIYALGPLAPEARVVLSFVLRRDSRERLPFWRDVLVAVEPARGSALPGSPGFVILLRMWYAIARVV